MKGKRTGGRPKNLLDPSYLTFRVDKRQIVLLGKIARELRTTRGAIVRLALARFLRGHMITQGLKRRHAATNKNT